MPSAQPMTPYRTVLHAALLLFGVLCGSTAVIMIKASTEHPFLVASYRLLVAGGVLLPLFFRDLKAWRSRQGEPGYEPYSWRQVSWSLVPAVVLAIHFMSWVVGARMTQVANASLIVNLTPVFMPFYVWVLFRERVTGLELLGTVFTLGGMFALSGSHVSLSSVSFQGDLICFGSMLCFALYLALGRKNSGRLPLWLYMVPLYLIAGVLCFLCALPFVNPMKSYTLLNVALMVGLGLVPTVVGHTVLNYSLKFFRGQVVSVTNLAQPIFAAVLAFFLFRELPAPAFYLSAALIFLGVVIVLYSGYRRRAGA
jgi:drug/metabolite transporter (DMT)-like permease